MPPHQCSESNRLLRIEKILDGDSRAGLIEQVLENNERINRMEKDLNSLAVSYSAIAKTMLEIDITERIKAENETAKIQQRDNRMRYLTIISIVFGIAIPLTALILSVT